MEKFEKIILDGALKEETDAGCKPYFIKTTLDKMKKLENI
jgi:hypothetical protein